MGAERAIQTVEALPVIQADTSTIMQIIGRAASDQSIDIEKLERLAAMYERLTDRQAVQAFGAAMSAAQAETGRVSADASNPQTKSKYASYAALDRELRPVYTRHGFSLSFGTADGAPPECVRVTCLVAHAEGHRETYHIDMPADGKGAKGGDVMTKTHAMGAAASYGQRYLLKLIFNIAVGEDGDGNDPRPQRHQQSAGATAAISALNGCNTLEELKAWKAGNAAMVQTLPEASEIIRLCNERVEKLKGAAR